MQPDLPCSRSRSGPENHFIDSNALSPQIIELALSYAERSVPETGFKDQSAFSCSMYYGFTRALRPCHALIVGTSMSDFAGRIALGIRENGAGRLTMIESSRHALDDLLSGNFYRKRLFSLSPRGALEEYREQGILKQYELTSEEFFVDYERHNLPKIEFALIDADRPFKDVRMDLACVMVNSRNNAIFFLHEGKSARKKPKDLSKIERLLESVNKEAFELISIPSGSSDYLIRIVHD
ncbi:MAG: hypothetical protein AAGU11_00095 [Syntrophobacteraceae bacterium]